MSRTDPVNVVIGAASGMGAAVASLLAPRGRLLLADRDADPLTGMAADLDADVTTMACDVTVQADRSIPYRLLKRVIKSAGDARFANFKLMAFKEE